jgi:hypothetical protein
MNGFCRRIETMKKQKILVFSLACLFIASCARKPQDFASQLDMKDKSLTVKNVQRLDYMHCSMMTKLVRVSLSALQVAYY